MKNIRKIVRFNDCQYKELFKLNGVERYEAIKNLPLIAAFYICSFYTHCSSCPLFLDGKENRSYCVDCASDLEIYRALCNGAEFTKGGEAIE